MREALAEWEARDVELTELAPELQEWAQNIETLRWSGLVADADWRLRWVSPELRAFVTYGDPEADLGLGLHLIEAFVTKRWFATVHPDSMSEMTMSLGPYFKSTILERWTNPGAIVPEALLSLFDQIDPLPAPASWTGSFLYVDPSELPAYRVDFLFSKVTDEAGNLLGHTALFYMGIRPNLLALMVRGDSEMYERMARLVEPGPRQGAVLFCDLAGSGQLSRQLSSSSYFKLVRQLWTGIDATVAENTGIVGKHAGDGASAYFLVDDLGTATAAAAAAVRTARRIHEISSDIFREALGSECLMKVGLHWGGTLYMGQLVPGGRLDVTALGDEVNEAARLEETSRAGETIASKQLLEQLNPDAAAGLGLALEKVAYRPLAELEGASDKAIRDAGALAVTVLT